MIWRVPRFWDGSDVWILGGGPSVSKQFGIPERIIQNVLERTSPPSVYSPYMEFLHDKHVIGINVAYLLGDWIDIVFFGDKHFFLEHQNGLAEYKGMKVSCTPEMRGYNWVKYLERDTKHGRGISPNPMKVSWNGNSGAAAISLAVHAGARRIFLLGFDMTLSTAKRQHWHDVYKRGTISDPKKLRGLPFDRHLRGFENIHKDAKTLGIPIINVCPESAITQFPKMSLQEAITLIQESGK